MEWKLLKGIKLMQKTAKQNCDSPYKTTKEQNIWFILC